MKNGTDPQPVLVRFADAKVNQAYGDTIHFHLTAAQTGGKFTQFTDCTPPGGGPPPHFHATEDEWWYVVEGEAEFFDGSAWTRVAPGGAVFMPRNARHTFRNAGQRPLKQVIHTAPAGFERFFQLSHDAFQRDAQPDVPSLLRIGAGHGIHFYTLAPAPEPAPTLLPAAIVQPDAGRSLKAFGDEVIVLLDGKQTGGQFTSFVDITPPGGGPPPHWHEREDEWFHVLEGQPSFLVEGSWLDAHPGDAVFVPRGRVHTFRNNTQSPTRMLVHTSPSGFEEFYAEAAVEFARAGGPDMNRCLAIAAKFGIQFAQP